MEPIARAGEVVRGADGAYLCTVAEDIHTTPRLRADLFRDSTVDFSSPEDRMPVTAWFVRRVLRRDKD